MPEINIKELPAAILAFAGAMVVTWYYIPRVIRVVNERHLTDKPHNHKIHKREIPTLGGVGILMGFTLGFLLTVDNYMPGVSYFTAAALMLFFIGLKDDLVYLDPKKKLLGEIGAALIITLFTDLRFTSLHGFLGITDIPVWATYILTIFLIVLILNSFNLIDGIDGLAASVGIIASVTFGLWFWFSNDYGYAIMAAALLGALVVFFWFNISSGPNKIFMGDTGSLVIGFILAVFAIRFNKIIATDKTFYNLHSAPAVSIAILIVPLYDTLRVIILRLYDRKSPFIADNRHIHHMMLHAGFSHRKSTMIISLFNIFIIAIAFTFDYLGILVLGLILLLFCLGTTELLRFVVRKREAGLQGISEKEIMVINSKP